MSNFPVFSGLLGFLALIASPSIEAQTGENLKIPALESLQFPYEVRAAELVKPMAKLVGSYRNQLTKLQDQFREGGNHEGVAAVKGELESFESGRFRSVSRFSELSRVREIFIRERAKIHSALKSQLTTLHSEYRKNLGKLQDELARAGMADEALVVKGELEKLVLPGGPPEEWWLVEVADSFFQNDKGTWTSETARVSGRMAYSIESDQTRGRLDLTFSDSRMRSDPRRIGEAVLQFRVFGGKYSETDALIQVLKDGKRIGSVKGAGKNKLVKIPLDASSISGSGESITLQIRCGKNAVIILPEWSADPPLLLLNPED